MTTKENLLDVLADSTMYRTYERSFGDATGLPLTLREPDSWQVCQKNNPHRNPFCALMGRGSRTCAACLQAQEALTEAARDNSATVTCFAGLTDSAVPIRLGDEVVGYLQTGQISLKPLNEAEFARIQPHLERLSPVVPMDELKAAWLDSPCMSRKQYDGALKLLTFFADQLGQLSNQLSLQQANVEPPAINRARTYIQEHLSEEISLSKVAQAVHMSRFYFCKMFRKHTGLNFTDYVSRMRIERSKELLLNPHLRISEIAYEVGFQSLTHFNRVFRKVIGHSPTEFRDRVPVI
jgi:AraC-like DNA-binding protein/ligand-binding sensor protein